MSPIANMLVQLKNAQAVGAAEVLVPYSAMKHSILEILRASGYVSAVEKKNKKSRVAELPYLAVSLSKDTPITGARMVSKPSRRLYAGKADIRPVKSGSGISIMTTPKGVMTGVDAKKAGVGGEIICEIW